MMIFIQHLPAHRTLRPPMHYRLSLWIS